MGASRNPALRATTCGVSDDRRPFWRNVLTYGAASVLLGSALHVANIVWTHFLTPEDYGRFANLEVVFGFAMALMTFGQYQYHVTFTKKAEGREQLSRVAGGFVMAAIAVGLVVAAASYLLPASLVDRTLGEGIPPWALASVLAVGGLAVGRHIAQGVSEGEGRALHASLWKEAVDGARPVIAVALFFGLGWTWEARWGGLLAAHAGASVLALVLLTRSGHLRMPTAETELRAPLRFVMPVVVSMSSFIAYDSADRLFLTAYAGLDAVGRYHVAYKLAAIAQTVNVVMLRSFTPLYYGAFHAGEHEEATKLIWRTAARTFVGVLVVALGLPAILWIVPAVGEGYEAALPIIPVVALGLGFYGLSTFWQAALYARSRSFSVLLIGSSTALGNVGLNALLVPRYQEMGAAVATLAAFAIMLGVTVLVVRGIRREEKRDRADHD